MNQFECFLSCQKQLGEQSLMDGCAGEVGLGDCREMLLQGEAERRYVTNILGSSMEAFFPSCPEIAEILHHSGLQSMNAMGKQR